ncbi:MAG: ABC transporter ATP-binding protein [Vicinamibacterales bacterium]
MIADDGNLEPAGDEHTTFSTGEFFRRLGVYFFPHKGKVALILLACSLETGFYWIVPLAFRHLIDNTLAVADRRGLIQVLSVLCVGSVVASAASLWRGRYWARVESQVVSDIRFRLYHQLQRLSVSSYAKTSTGELLSRFSNDLSSVATALTMGVVWGALPALDCILGTAILAVLDWRLACLAALVWPWCLLVPPRIARRAAPTAYARKQREAEMLEVVQEQIATQSVVRAYGLARLRMVRFFHADARLFEASVRSAFLTAFMDQASMSGILLLQVLTLALGAWLAFAGDMTIGTLAAFQALFLGVSTSLLYFTQYLRSLLPARAGMQRIEEFLAAGGAIDDPPGAGTLSPFSHDIAFEHVSFAYDGAPVLRDVSLTIRRGSNVAIVGPSGSGKSTIVSLLLRFHDPASGTIRVDGVDLKTVAQESWRSQLGVVFQENLLFRASLAENIRMGRPDAPDAEVEEAARLAGIDDVIRRLPEGYRTAAGELGGRLSGGERQRIALARALALQPQVLLLDEATSALDPQTEAEINVTLRRAAAGRTVISVTHRLGSVAHCDHIFVMDRGRLAEQGTHEQLIGAGGIYAGLWRSDPRSLD